MDEVEAAHLAFLHQVALCFSVSKPSLVGGTGGAGGPGGGMMKCVRFASLPSRDKAAGEFASSSSSSVASADRGPSLTPPLKGHSFLFNEL